LTFTATVLQGKARQTLNISMPFYNKGMASATTRPSRCEVSSKAQSALYSPQGVNKLIEN
jgi:hypothetical protein